MIVIPYKVFGYCHYYTIKAPRDFIQIKRAFKEICSIFSRGKQAYVIIAFAPSHFVYLIKMFFHLSKKFQAALKLLFTTVRQMFTYHSIHKKLVYILG